MSGTRATKARAKHYPTKTDSELNALCGDSEEKLKNIKGLLRQDTTVDQLLASFKIWLTAEVDYILEYKHLAEIWPAGRAEEMSKAAYCIAGRINEKGDGALPRPPVFCRAVEYVDKLTGYREWVVECEREPPGHRSTVPAPTKQKVRPTKADMINRNRAVLMYLLDFQSKHDRLPTVDEVVAETGYTREQIYSTASYKDGMIGKRSTHGTIDMAGGSVIETEQYDEKSPQYARAKRRTQTDQEELDALIDEQKGDGRSDFVR
jgi:hypothetical protein